MLKKYLIPLIAIIIVVVGCIKVNIYNTTALSPIGNTEDNFNLVSKEFGEDFSEFIKDKSPVKIYIDEVGDSEARVKVYNKEINLTKNNPFLRGVEPVFNYIEEAISNVTDKFDKNTENNDINKNDVIENNNNNNSENNTDVTGESSGNAEDENKTEVDTIIDDFINSQNNSTDNGQ